MQYFGVALAGRLDEALSMAFGRLLRVTASVCRVRIFSSELGIDELPVWREALLGPSDLLGRICALPQSFPGFRSCRRCLSIRGGGVPGWDSEGYGENPYRAPQQPPYAEQLPDTRYLADSPFVGDARYHRADVTQSHWASEWDQGYPDLRASTNDPAASARGGYDFRGPHEVRDWNASSWRDSYRFRPLTDLERRRIDTATGWRPRPRSPYPFVEGIRQVDVSPPVETYGYQSDGGWLDRYYGRP